MMHNNADKILSIIDYIEEHLTEKIDLDQIANVVHYSKYHLHRMFTNIVGFTVHNYIQRRKLTEAAKLLVFSNHPIIDIALFSGYKSQRSFTTAFKMLYKKSPNAFRECGEFYPLQLKFVLQNFETTLFPARMMDIKIISHDEIYLVGYMTDTKKGFGKIDECWTKLHKIKNSISNKINGNFLIGINDYSDDFSYESERPRPVHYAAAEISSFNNIPKDMVTKIIPINKYVVFTYRGKIQDHIYPIMKYIYKVWFSQSTSQLNDYTRYDLVRYGEIADYNGLSIIEVWIPILSSNS